MAKMVVLGVFVLQLICCCSLYGHADAGSLVKFLPGFQGPLPFHLETGYIGVGDVQYFYYFTKSESNPKSDPLMIWLSGGPGCSSFSGLVYEIGPITFVPVEYNGSMPELILNPYSWTKAASIIFLDLPVGTGFSYATIPPAKQSNTLQTTHQAYEFVQKWLLEHQEFMSNPLYIGGDSFAGQFVPVISQVISNGNEKGNNPQINLKGYVMGNPVTFLGENSYQFPFAHGMALISDEFYESLKENCKGEKYQMREPGGNINPENLKCVRDIQILEELTSDIQVGMILDPSCNSGLQTSQKLFTNRRFLDEKHINLVNLNSQSSNQCREYLYDLSDYWMNDKSVQEALHIAQGSIGNWERCSNDLDYIYKLDSVVPYHANLNAKGYRSLVYSGDHDMIVPFQSTQAWIRSLNYSIIDEWRQWNVEGQVAGYTRTYSNNMTFATVKGAGHIAPEFKPSQCQVMVERWFSSSPL
ncbi:PREDICTED: serine carboxypeptidase-like 12 isoform X3 [Ipomoea nil]|uniref:serine carboxypeptidase-like 12 isoform X3 n=1 Tax=Ipomoea nil TaxID=35883 RepID=UPI000901621D|nr:PREDICTED: serine carboxypeptidase-like 12 isoform X3 [Ipomoea nil]